MVDKALKWPLFNNNHTKYLEMASKFSIFAIEKQRIM
jgi:hypothetical protein